MKPEVIDRLALVFPLLASDQDGEVLSAARTIIRTLKSSGHDLHDLVAQLRGEKPAAEIAVAAAHHGRQQPAPPRPKAEPAPKPAAGSASGNKEFPHRFAYSIIEHETAKAWRIQFFGFGEAIWIPKSQAKLEPPNFVLMTDWLVKEKNFDPGQSHAA